MTFAKYRPILSNLNEAGYAAYFVGGSVRDYLLGLKPKDFDIATSATPAQVAEVFPGTQVVGAHFGVSLVPFEGEVVEVATFRKDGVYVDGRHPLDVTFTTKVSEDARRRDFTVNALYMDKDMEILDLVDGQEDVILRRLQCVGKPSDRFEQDALRMMRAVRFACTKNMEVTDDTKVAMWNNADRLSLVSAERVQDELVRVLTSGRAAFGVELMLETGLLEVVLPEVAALVGCDQNPKHHPEGDVFTHTMLLLSQLEKDCSVTLAMAALLHDIGKPGTKGEKNGQPTFYGHEELGATMSREIMNRLKFPNEVTSTVVGHVAQHMEFRLVKEMRKAKVLRFVRQPNFGELLALHKLDATAGRVKLDDANFVEQLLAETPEQVMRPQTLVDGRDLIAMGLKPGPVFKHILHEVETAQLNGEVSTKEQALEVAREMAVAYATEVMHTVVNDVAKSV